MKKQSGFTLIELSIVISVIGLMIAGIMSGQRLMHQAKIRAQIAQFDKYKSAYYTFKTQYLKIPGDFARASEYWAGVPNGDGDGEITNHCDGLQQTSGENLKFFHHLSASKIITDGFDGTWRIGSGYPELKISKGQGMGVCGAVSPLVVHFYQINSIEATKQHKAMLSINVVNPSGVSSRYNDNYGILAPGVAEEIDLKIDDGIARTGSFKADSVYNHSHTDAGTCLDGVDGDYNLMNEGLACNGYYVIEK